MDAGKTPLSEQLHACSREIKQLLVPIRNGRATAEHARQIGELIRQKSDILRQMLKLTGDRHAQ